MLHRINRGLRFEIDQLKFAGIVGRKTFHNIALPY
jgi:hypothetical protein